MRSPGAEQVVLNLGSQTSFSKTVAQYSSMLTPFPGRLFRQSNNMGKAALSLCLPLRKEAFPIPII